MRKYTQKKVKGVKVVKKIEGKGDRPLFPRPAVFKDKTVYNRNSEKQKLQKEIDSE